MVDIRTSYELWFSDSGYQKNTSIELHGSQMIINYYKSKLANNEKYLVR